MKRVIPIVLLILMLFSASAEIEFTDSSGSVISLPEVPRNVCVLFSSFAEMWTLAGGEINITVYESIERGFASDDCILVDGGAGKNVDVETLILSNPDLVIGSMDIPAHVSAVKMLDKAGIPTALFRVESIEDYVSVMDTLTDITGNKDAYYEHAQEVFSRCAEIIEKASVRCEDAPSILFVRSGSGYSSAKAKTAMQHFAADMLEDLGAKNIADEIPVILDGLSFEEILMKDPNVIFISLMGNEEKAKAYMTGVLESRNWQMLTAVREGRVYFLEKEMFQYKPNARWDEAYETLYRMLYSEAENDEE